MDFFEHQSRARKKTKWLIAYFILAVVGIIAVLTVIASLLTGESLTNPQLVLMVAGGVVAVVILGALYRISELSRGGTVVAEMLGGRPVDPNSRDLKEQQFRNVVEEMAIASGIPVPEIYILDHEEGVNAFAAGNSTADAVVAVTRGALETFDRDELQGVVAHEFSHILNGDMRMNIRLMGFLNGILLLAIMGRILFGVTGRARLISGGGRNNNSGGAQVAILLGGLALLVVGYIGVFFAKLIKAAVSRQREFLADASAVQFTRNPDGIAGALWKIGRGTSRIQSERADEASHMFFGNSLRSSFGGLFATHPPIDQRIQAIAPNFHPDAPRKSPPPVPAGSPVKAAGAPSDTGIPGVPPIPGVHLPGMGSLPAAGQIAIAAGVLAALPEFARAASRESAAAESLIYALLLSSDEPTRARQLESIEISEVERSMVLADLRRLPEIREEDRLTTVDLCLPALRKLSHDQYATFRMNVKVLMDADGSVSLFEYVLHKALVRHLDGHFTDRTETPVRFHVFTPVLPDANVVFSALAYHDSGEEPGRESAFRQGVDALGSAAGGFKMERLTDIDLASVDHALDQLAGLDPVLKRDFLKACAAVVTHDGVIAPKQGSLLRAIADTLECAIPPSALTSADA